MGIMTNRNSRSGKLVFFLISFVVLAGFRPGFTEDQDIEQIREAAKLGNAGAQYLLGLMYDQGEGVPQDYRKAVKWYRKAAEQGHAGAQYQIGVMYVTSEGVPEDYREAARWYRLAAEQGNPFAQYNLGVCAAGQFRNVRERETIAEELLKGVLWSRFGVDRLSSHLWVPGIGG